MQKTEATASPFDLEELSEFRHLQRAEFAYAALKHAFANGRLQSGDRILEMEIAKALGISRTPVREAIKRLLATGLIEVTPGRGLSVTRLDRQQIIEIYALREVMEATASGFAAQHASQVEIEHLRELLRQFAASEGDLPRLRQINRLFHQGIYEASHNRYLLQWLNEFQDTMALLRASAFAYAEKERYLASLAEHTQILDAIEARDVEAADRTARIHVRAGQTQRLKMLFEGRGV